MRPRTPPVTLGQMFDRKGYSIQTNNKLLKKISLNNLILKNK